MKHFLLILVSAFFLFSCANNEQADSKDNNTEITTEEGISELKLEVHGMTCNGCENAIEKHVSALEGIATVKASHTDSTVLISYDASKCSLDAIKSKIDETGYKVIN